MSIELLEGTYGIKSSGSGTLQLTNDYMLLSGYIWVRSENSYIPILDCTHTFEYDFVYENDAGNYFYIGIERYTEDKTTDTNSSTIYQVSTANTAHAKTRVRGTVNMNQVLTNNKKTAYIRLRILNAWANSSVSTSTAKIYRLSLREITETTNKIATFKSGQLTSDTFWESCDKASFNQLNVVESNEIYEF